MIFVLGYVRLLCFMRFAHMLSIHFNFARTFITLMCAVQVLLMDKADWESDECEEIEEEASRDAGEADDAEKCAAAAVAVTAVIRLAERYHDRVDAAQLLELLPTDTPIAGLLRYFGIVLEYGSTKKRNMQVRRKVLCAMFQMLLYSFV